MWKKTLKGLVVTAGKERYKRMIRRGYTNHWNFFCTYTFDSRKHTEESFRKSLMNTLYHFSSRRDWRYIGAWERGELGERLHFHALTYIPDGQMPGELEEHEDYSTKRHRREKSIQNSFFNERFGRTSTSDSGEAIFRRSIMPMKSLTVSNTCSNTSAKMMKKSCTPAD